MACTYGYEASRIEYLEARLSNAIRLRDELLRDCEDLRTRIKATARERDELREKLARLSKPEPLTVADVERIVDAKLAAAPRQAGTWMGSGLHRVRHWPGLMVAAHVTPDGWHVYGEVGGLLARGYSTGIEGQRAADAALQGMGVKLL